MIELEITPCCTDPLLFLDNGTPDQVPNASYSPGNNTWVVQNQIISLSGTFEIINSNMHFINCMILMGPGAEMVVHQGRRLSITGNCEVMAACDIMWKGIYVRDGGEVYMAGNAQNMSYTFFKDAEYALRFEKNASYAIAGYIQFERCYVNFYFPSLTGGSQHVIQPLNGNQNQWYNSLGTAPGGYTWFYKLLDPYPGQAGYSNDRMSFACVLMYDVANFSFFSNNYMPSPNGPAGVSFIHRYNFGIKAHNSNLYLKNFFISRQVSGQTKFSNIGIYADAPPVNNIQYQIDIDGILSPLPAMPIMYWYTSSIWGSRTSMQLVNMNLNMNNTLLGGGCYWPNQSICYFPSSYGYVEPQVYHLLASAKHRNITVTNCHFQFAAQHIKLTDLLNSQIHIENNWFDSPKFLPPTSFNNSAINLIGHSSISDKVTLNVINNLFDELRIRLFMQNIDGMPGNILDNKFIISSKLYDSNWPLYLQPHYGFWTDRCTNLRFANNVIKNSSGFQNYSDYPTLAIGFNIKTSGSFINNGTISILNSEINNFGTAVRFVDRCYGVFLRCNGMEHCSRGVYFDYSNITSPGAEISSQGTAGHPAGNEWQNWNAPYRAEGSLLVNNPVNWFYNPSLTTDQYPFPHNVTPSISFNPSSTNGVPSCVAPLKEGDMEIRLDKVIHTLMTYSIYEDESDYFDKEWAYLTLKYNDTLRSEIAANEEFYEQHRESNYELFDQVKNLIAASDYDSAAMKLSFIVPSNDFENDFIYVLGIYLNMARDPEYEMQAEDSIRLNAIAWSHVWRSGNAAFTARALLGLEVNDYSNGLRMAQNSPTLKSLIDRRFVITPNPVKDILTINTEGDEEYRIVIKDISGRAVMENHVSGGHRILDLAKLQAGIYFLNVLNEGNICYTEKVIKL